jgi:hypothetical protein
MMNLTDWTRRQGIHPQIAFRWFREGTLAAEAGRQWNEYGKELANLGKDRPPAGIIAPIAGIIAVHDWTRAS